MTRIRSRPRFSRSAATATAGVALAVGACVQHRQTQFFAVHDPETGARNYYRLSIEGGNSGRAVEYQMQAGYFSAAAVDILRGQMPKVPSLDLEPGQQEAFDSLLEQYYGSLLQQARRKAGITETGAPAEGRAGPGPGTGEAIERAAVAPGENATQPTGPGEGARSAPGSAADGGESPALTLAEMEEQTQHLARLTWFASLSPSDVASVGMTMNTNPYQFRKLVFWSSVQNIDINQFATEIDGIVEEVTSLGMAFKEIARTRADDRSARRRQQALERAAVAQRWSSVTRLVREQYPDNKLLGAFFDSWAPQAPAPAPDGGGED